MFCYHQGTISSNLFELPCYNARLFEKMKETNNDFNPFIYKKEESGKKNDVIRRTV